MPVPREITVPNSGICSGKPCSQTDENELKIHIDIDDFQWIPPFSSS